MKKLVIAALLLAPLQAFAVEVLVLASGAVNMLSTAPRNTTAVDIQNLGPYSIWCTLDGTTPVVNKSRQILSGGVWQISGDILKVATVKCIASTADQVTGAATIVTEGQ